MLRVAVGAAAGLLVAGLLRGGASSKPKPHTRTRERKRLPHNHYAHRQHEEGSTQTGDGAAAAGSGAGAAASAAEVWQSAVPRGGIYLLLLLQAVASAAAVLWAQPLRPPSIAPHDWQQLVSLLACSAMVLSLAGAWRHYQQTAAAGGGVVRRVSWRMAEGRQQQQQQAAPPQDLTGVWLKDKAASDSLDEACDAMQLGGLVRLAIGLIKGVEIREDGGAFTFILHSGILWFKITEQYSMDGRAARFKRRDLRRGTHVGRVERCPATGGMLLRVEWGAPLGGNGLDHFYLASADVLHMDTTLVMESGRTLHYRQVYRRKS